jgi:transposase
MSTRFDLTDEEWSLIDPLLPHGLRGGGGRVNDRRVLNGIFYVLRTGCPWRDLPERYGPYTTCYNRYNRWARRDVWKAVFNLLARRSRDSLHLIDSTIVKAHRAASGAKGGNWRRLSDAHAAVGRRKFMPWSMGWGGRSRSS